MILHFKRHTGYYVENSLQQSRDSSEDTRWEVVTIRDKGDGSSESGENSDSGISGFSPCFFFLVVVYNGEGGNHSLFGQKESRYSKMKYH